MPDDPLPIIHIVEDEEPVRDALVFRLAVAGMPAQAYESAEAFLAGVHPDAEGCVVTDLRLPGMDGQQLLEHLAAAVSPLAVIVMSGFGDIASAVRAMQAGAVDFLEKPIASAALIQTIQRALNVRRNEQRLRSETTAAAARIATLSGRERDVFDGLVEGKLGKQIAIDLAISPRTVEVHRAHIMEKLGVRTTSDLIRMGVLTRLQGGGDRIG